MDFSKFKTSDWLKIGGALGFLIFGTFVGWASGGGESGGNAFDFFFTGTIPWILIIAVGVLAFLVAGGVLKPGKLPWHLIFLAASTLAALLVIIRLLIGPKVEVCFLGECVDVELDRAAGLFLSAISAVVVLVGSFLGFKESGGDISDLTDMNKLKASFGGGDPSAPPPPPPPPGMTPPPPPPPPGG